METNNRGTTIKINCGCLTIPVAAWLIMLAVGSFGYSIGYGQTLLAVFAAYVLFGVVFGGRSS